jgi:hypothetical protein
MASRANDNTIVSAIAAWQDRLALVSRNLAEINEFPALARVKARMRATPPFYTGETASRIADALAALEELWKDYLLLNALLDQVEALRKQSGLFHDHEDEIHQLLHGPSITLPVAHVPLAERSLLSSAQHSDQVTPDELLGAMHVLFALAKDTIVEVDASEAQLRPRLEVLSITARELSRRADALGRDEAEMATVVSSVEPSSAVLTADPLGAGRRLAEAETALANWRTRLEAAEREHEALEGAFSAATAALDELRRLNRVAQRAHDSATSTIAGSLALRRPLEAPVIAHLGTWLETLNLARQRGDWLAAKSGLDKWTAACDSHQEQERRAAAANTAPLDAREELRGRLKALRAKASAHAARGTTFEPAVVRLGNEIEGILYSQPADLAKAAALLTAYDTAINRDIRKT